jgi:hypothetical protein
METDKGVPVGTEIGLQIVKSVPEKDKQLKAKVGNIITKKKKANRYSLFMDSVKETAKIHSDRLRFTKESRNVLENTILTIIDDVVLPECIKLLNQEEKTQLTSRFVIAAVKNQLDKTIYSGFEKTAYSSTREIFNKKSKESQDKKLIKNS